MLTSQKNDSFESKPSESPGIALVRRAIREEYLASHAFPWIIGFSGGKDSTLVTQLVVECLLTLAPDERTRPITILYNDTQVESPVFAEFVQRQIDRIANGVDALRLPISVKITKPDPSDTFWVNLLGRGYPAPNRNFRWCMDRLKIRPSANYIRDTVTSAGGAILLLGVRRDESAARAQRLKKFTPVNDNDRVVPNHEVPGCSIFRPIIDLTTDEVWDYLRSVDPPWGRSNSTLFDIYQDAGLCNGTQSCALMEEETISESSNMTARFGCWTCTVVRKDRSLEALIESGYKNLEILLDYRNKIRLASDSPHCRSKMRRNGVPGLGPLTLETRKQLLELLLEAQTKSGIQLISDSEIRLIREQWSLDEITDLVRALSGPASARRDDADYSEKPRAC